MFTGLIEDLGTLYDIRKGSEQATITVSTALPMHELELGESIAVNGSCLTVTSFGEGRFTADVSAETLSCTTLGSLVRGTTVNLERALRLSDRLGGHLVTGHVDSIGQVVHKQKEGNGWRFGVEVDEASARLLVAKGSVTIDGVSLTVNTVDVNRFDVMIIPHTLEQTTLRSCEVGAKVNIETDLIGKYVARLLGGKPPEESRGLSLDLLAKHGFL